MSEQEFDDLGAPIPPKEAAPALAAEAKRLMENPAFTEGCRRLTQAYMRKFCELKPDDPTYDRQCMRAQVAVNVIGDIIGQLRMMVDHQKVDNETIKKTMRGNDNGR